MRKLYYIWIPIIVITLVVAGCSNGHKLTYNTIDTMVQFAPPYIEGAYTTEIDAALFAKETGFSINNCISQNGRINTISYRANYDGNDELLNISSTIRYNDNDENYIYLVFYSDSIWSDKSYSPIDYVYNLTRVRKTTINDITVVLGYCSNNKMAPESPDIYTAVLSLGEIAISIEMQTYDKSDFEQFLYNFIEYNSI